MTQAERLNFGDALGELHGGNLVARIGWNGRGMHLVLVGSGWSTDREQLTDRYRDAQRLPFIAMHTAAGELVPWLASQTDLLATDWIIVG